MRNSEIRLTKYSHGAGCGCKLSPAVLDKILANRSSAPDEAQRLLVGNHSRDDAGAYDLGDGQVLLSTTDFFMPIVDDPFQFGRIASANAISDIYAMGGRPVMAIAILGWPIDVLPAEVAGEVLEGSRSLCREAGVALAGGHSIDNREPIFGLAVNGLVELPNLKRNDQGKVGDLLYLTKPLGVGILSTAEKKGLLREEDLGRAAESMMGLNSIGAELGKIRGVHGMTDVTGFGVLGHLTEMCQGAEVGAVIEFGAFKQLTDLGYYLRAGAIPGGTTRNWESYGAQISEMEEHKRQILADPQTSGGLLLAVDREDQGRIEALFDQFGLQDFKEPVGVLVELKEGLPLVEVR